MKRALAAALFVAIAIAALAPIRSYDFFWHLATGRWIVEHHALPQTDPFALASANTKWINGEWLWELGAYAVHAIAGERGISIVQALFVAAIFAIAFLFAARDHDVGLALFVAAIAFAGASDRLGVRPAAAAAMFVAIAIGLLGLKRPTIAYVVLTIIWINVHPSALLAPLLALAVRRWPVAAASAVALLVNPFGWNAVLAPLRTSLATSGQTFVNVEWLPTPFAVFPLIYVTIVVMVIAFIATPEKRANVWRMAIFALLAFLAIRYVRNHALYFAALPMLVPATMRKFSRNTSLVVGACAIFPIGWAYAATNHSLGVDASYFPVRAVSRLASLNLKGNIYDADQFGGYLEWTFYPQRRVVTDGRNELFAAFNADDERARRDSRAWHALLDKYAVDLAVDEYLRPIEVMDVATRQTRVMPASLVRYRRRDWALIAYDGVAMVFARRAAFPPELIAKIEMVGVVPDGR